MSSALAALSVETCIIHFIGQKRTIEYNKSRFSPLANLSNFADSGELVLTTPRAITQENVGRLRELVRISGWALVEFGAGP
jgi:hypothetical protein